MRISGRGQITIPKALRERFGMNHDVEVDITATGKGLLFHKRTSAQRPVECVCAVPGHGGDTDDHLDEIHGR